MTPSCPPPVGALACDDNEFKMMLLGNSSCNGMKQRRWLWLLAALKDVNTTRTTAASCKQLVPGVW